jgi:SAM-dependent methyltransferase
METIEHTITAEQMIAVNRQQAEFYDRIQEADEVDAQGYANNEDANMATRLIASLRYQQQRAVASTGIRERVRDMHKRWFNEKAGGSFLEIGCFSGSDYTLDLVKAAGNYTGVELSKAACASLRRKIAENGAGDRATVVCGDFLEFQPGRKFDLIYAHGVLHHFQNPEPLFARIRDLIADDGWLVFVEPVAINPVFRALRAMYRPFQSDAAWEWPFRRETVGSLKRRFDVVDGFGYGRFSAPISLMCGVPLLGLAIHPAYRWIARKEVVPFDCTGYWQSSMVLAKCLPRCA